MIKKNLFTTILNLIGLSIAFTAFIVITIQIRHDFSFNKNVPDYDRVYRVEFQSMGGYGSYNCRPALSYIPNVSDVELMGEFSAAPYLTEYKISASDEAKISKAKIFAGTKGILDILDVNIEQGDISSFDSLNAVVINSTLAKKLFPNNDAIGHEIYINSELCEEFVIAGIFSDLPSDIDLCPDIFTSLRNYRKDDFSNYSFTSYVKLRKGADPRSVAAAFEQQLIENTGWEKTTNDNLFRLTRVDKLFFQTDISNDNATKGNIATDITLVTTAILILLIALINFLNISMAGIPEHIKSINTRKILGSRRSSLIWAQVEKAVLLAMISMAISIIVLFILSYSSLTMFIQGSMALKDNIMLILGVTAIAIFVSVIAGLYPAIYSTSFQPAMVVKGGFAHTLKGHLLRNILIGLQFCISMILIIFTLFINIQSKYMKSYDNGFTSNNILGFTLPRSLPTKSEAFKQNILKNPKVLDMTFCLGGVISDSIRMKWGREYNGENVSYTVMPVAYNFTDFFDMYMVDGRSFLQEDYVKEDGSYIFNEAAVNKYHFKCGESISGHDGLASFVGIVKDFNFLPLQYGIDPIALYCFGAHPWAPLNMCYIKMVPEISYEETCNIIYNEMRNVDANVQVDDTEITYLDDSIGGLYAREDNLAKLILIACLISVLISIVGVFGLVHYETQFRKKETALRRVMGAEVPNILSMINLVYLKICGICFIISAPVAYIIVKKWLTQYNYQSSIPIWIFLASFVLISVIVLSIVTLRSLKTATSDPVQSIKSE
ncbi:MAG: hypothetical protein GX664_01785 [Bacteroidales bacterium]|nr:hypothetical protein [Bacteroidales bacterium]